jgi:uncharacterized protein (TIGR00255 family)
MTVESMTGFGSTTFEVGGSSYRLELKSVNHKGVSLRMRTPNEFNFMEISLRKQISEAVLRGALDLSIQRESHAGSDLEVQIDEVAAEKTMTALKDLANRLELPAPTLDLGLKIGHFIHSGTTEVPQEDLSGALREAMDETLSRLMIMRRQEGEQLRTDLDLRLSNLEALLQTLEAVAPAVMERFEMRLKKRLDDMAQKHEIATDPARLNAELVIFSDRSDVTEETVRADAHLKNARKLLNGDERAKGKRLDFLAQELFREFNTVGSKCRDVGMATAVVDAKVELEKFREQVQNIV